MEFANQFVGMVYSEKKKIVILGNKMVQEGIKLYIKIDVPYNAQNKKDSTVSKTYAIK